LHTFALNAMPMEVYQKKIEIRWSDLDPNYHVRHSVYYDYGAFSRISFLNENAITPELMLWYNIGPILFREECLFRKEIKFGDELIVGLRLSKATEDMSRWTMVHELFRNAHELAATVTVDGAWIDTTKRKLANPPEVFRSALEKMPKTPMFSYIEARRRPGE
jgi:acyl-CoA thioester hydrolase